MNDLRLLTPNSALKRRYVPEVDPSDGAGFWLEVLASVLLIAALATAVIHHSILVYVVALLFVFPFGLGVAMGSMESKVRDLFTVLFLAMLTLALVLVPIVFLPPERRLGIFSLLVILLPFTAFVFAGGWCGHLLRGQRSADRDPSWSTPPAEFFDESFPNGGRGE